MSSAVMTLDPTPWPSRVHDDQQPATLRSPVAEVTLVRAPEHDRRRSQRFLHFFRGHMLLALSIVLIVR